MMSVWSVEWPVVFPRLVEVGQMVEVRRMVEVRQMADQLVEVRQILVEERVVLRKVGPWEVAKALLIYAGLVQRRQLRQFGDRLLRFRTHGPRRIVIFPLLVGLKQGQTHLRELQPWVLAGTGPQTPFHAAKKTQPQSPSNSPCPVS